MRGLINQISNTDNGQQAREINGVDRIFNTIETILNLSHDIFRRESGIADAFLGAVPINECKGESYPSAPGAINRIQSELDGIRAILNRVYEEQSRYQGVISA